MALQRPAEKTLLERYLPIVEWLPKYDWGKWLRFDIIAGLTVWALLVPEAMAYAGIAGVPPEAGLYTAPLALLGYALFGTSRHLFVGPSSTVAIVSASVVAPLAGGDAELYVALTSWLAILVGLLFVLFGLVRMGWFANFLAQPVLDGFIVGLAIVIALGQLDKIFGIEAEGENAVREFLDILAQFSDWDWLTVAIGFGALALLFAMHEYVPKIPAALTVMLLGILASVAFDLEGRDVETVGEIPAGLPDIGFPLWPGTELIGDLVPGALAVILVGYAESLAAAKAYGAKYGYEVDPNQEMIGLGVANFGAGISQGFVVDGSLSKTAAGDDAGQKSQMTGIIAAVLTLITILALTWLFEPLPEAVLGAIVIHAVWGLIDFNKIGRYWKLRNQDFWLALAAFLGVILIDVLPGILLGIFLSLGVLVYRASFPSASELGEVRVGDRKGYFDVEEIEGAREVAGVVVHRLNAPLIFSSAEYFVSSVKGMLWDADPPAYALVIDGEQMFDMDTTGAERLIALVEELRGSGVDVYLARFHGEARLMAERTGVIDAVGEERVYPQVNSAVAAAQAGGPSPERS